MMMREKQKVTVFTLAEALGLSPSTVSYVINGRAKQYRISEKTAQRVLEMARKLDYVPNDLARGLRVKSTGILGLVVADLSCGWTDRLLKGLMSVVEPKGYSVHLSLHYWNEQREQRELMSLIQRRADGIVLLPMGNSLDSYPRILSRDIPFILVGDPMQEPSVCSSVVWDMPKAMDQFVAELLASGKRRVAYVHNQIHSRMIDRKMETFAQAWEKAEQTSDTNVIVEEFWPLPDMEPDEGGAFGEALHQMLSAEGPKPQALIMQNDCMALKAAKFVQEWGFPLPEDFQVIGLGSMGGLELSGVRLSALNEPVEEIGAQCGRIFLGLVDKEEPEPVNSTIDFDPLLDEVP